MAHTAKLMVETKTYEVLECNYNYFRHQQENGQPESGAIGGNIQLIMKSPGDNDLFLHDWIRGSTENKEGVIVFEVADKANISKKHLFFKGAYCVSLRESFNAYGDGQMLTSIALSAAEIIFGLGQKTCLFKS
jgi:hypothetical protein